MKVEFAFNLQQCVSIVGTPATGTVHGFNVTLDRRRWVQVRIVTTSKEVTYPWYPEDQVKAAAAPVATEAKPEERPA